MSADSVRRLSVKYRPTLSVEGWSSISRDIERHTPPTYSTDRSRLPLSRYSTDISADTWARYRPTLGRASVEILFKLVDRQSPISVDTWSVCRSKLGRHLNRHTRPPSRPKLDQVSVDILRESRPRCRSSIGRVSVEYRPTYRPTYSTDILDRHTPLTYSTDISDDTRSIVDRHLGRHLGERSTDTWLSIGRHALQVGRRSVATIGPYLVGMAVYTQLTPRPLCYDEAYRHIGPLSVVCGSTFGGILCIVNHLFC